MRLAAVMLAAVGVAQAAPRELRFVTEALPPYSQQVDGRATGPMVDVLQATCARLQWRCPVEVLPWRRALRTAQAGEVEGLFAIVTPPTTRPRFHVSPPVIDARYLLYARAGESLQFDGDTRPLAGRRLGVYGPSAAEDALRALLAGVADAQVEIETDNRTVLRKLAASQRGGGRTADPRGAAGRPARGRRGQALRLCIRAEPRTRGCGRRGRLLERADRAVPQRPRRRVAEAVWAVGVGVCQMTRQDLAASVQRFKNLLRNRALRCVAAAVALVFGAAYAFVQVKNRDCELLCGEASRGKAEWRVSGTVGARSPSKPATSTCVCTESNQQEK